MTKINHGLLLSFNRNSENAEEAAESQGSITNSEVAQQKVTDEKTHFECLVLGKPARSECQRWKPKELQ